MSQEVWIFKIKFSWWGLFWQKWSKTYVWKTHEQSVFLLYLICCRDPWRVPVAVPWVSSNRPFIWRHEGGGLHQETTTILSQSMDQRWGLMSVLHIQACIHKRTQMNDLPNIILFLLSVWDRWESSWQNAGPRTQPPVSQPYGSKRHLPRCQNHRISSCEWALLGVCSHTQKGH